MTHANAFNLIRLVAAGSVLLSHGFALNGRPEPHVAPGITLGGLAVFVFFSTSGYLVMQAWQRNPSAGPFLRNRALRIFPGLLAAVLVCALVVGPLATSRPLPQYFLSDGEVARYVLWNSVLRMVDRLPGVFETLPAQGAVNGSLWTIPHEVACYALLCVAARRRPLLWALCALTLPVAIAFSVFGWSIDAPLGLPGESKFSLAQFSRMSMFFWSGALLAAYRVEPSTRLMAGAAAVLVAAAGTHAFVPVAWLALPCLVVGIGRARSSFTPRSDWSYGLYLYAFPVQQLLVQSGVKSLPVSIALAAAITLALAALSWRWIERPALAYKTARRHPLAAQP